MTTADRSSLPAVTVNSKIGGEIERYTIQQSASSSSTTVYYKMIGMDAGTNGLWDSWIVTTSPDTAGDSYAGSMTTPLRMVYIAAKWTIES